MKILLTGGGTGGHITPLLTIVSEIKKMESEKGVKKSEFLFIGPKSEFNKNISEKEISIKLIQAGKLRRYFSFENFIDIFRIIIGIIQSLYFVDKFKPDLIFSKGGFVSVPPVIAGWFLRVPIITHESDIVPGLANRIISRFSKKSLVSFYHSKKYFSEKKVILTGSPVREEILQGDKNRARKIFNLNENIPTILIFGGSQGARKINKVILKSLPLILETFQVIHSCGNKNYEKLKIEVEEKNLKNISRYKIYPFLSSELKDAFALSDLVISRAGANSLFEIIALEKPSIIIPLSNSANNHQVENANFFQKRGMLINLNEKELNEKILTELLFKLFNENKIRADMIDKMHKYNNFINQRPVYNIIEEIFDFDN